MLLGQCIHTEGMIRIPKDRKKSVHNSQPSVHSNELRCAAGHRYLLVLGGHGDEWKLMGINNRPLLNHHVDGKESALMDRNGI